MLHITTQQELNSFIKPRKGEVKLGEVVSVIKNQDDFIEEMNTSAYKYVLFGIPEDIGVRMNRGVGGAYSAYTPALTSLLNIQENQFITGKDILILGYLDFFKDVMDFEFMSKKEGDSLVKKIDGEVSSLVKQIINCGKTPIIVGGGHNNAYGNLKGLSLAKKTPINVVNLDAHTDLRKLEERHSGNGFSYAEHDGYLERYFMFGIHENYTPQYIFDTIAKNDNFKLNTFEQIAIYKSRDFDAELERAITFISEKPYGIEIDLDSIQGFPSSAITPSGFTPEQARRFTSYMAQNKNASYLHICEGAPAISSDELTRTQVGEFLSFLISDFIKAKNKQ